jgi:hypothetical protein
MQSFFDTQIDGICQIIDEAIAAFGTKYPGEHIVC